MGTWATAPVALPRPEQPISAQENPQSIPRINNQTLRQIVHTSIGGSRVRVAFTNRYGVGPLMIGTAHVAIRDSDETIVAGTGRRLTFDGQGSENSSKTASQRCYP